MVGTCETWLHCVLCHSSSPAVLLELGQSWWTCRWHNVPRCSSWAFYAGSWCNSFTMLGEASSDFINMPLGCVKAAFGYSSRLLLACFVMLATVARRLLLSVARLIQLPRIWAIVPQCQLIGPLWMGYRAGLHVALPTIGCTHWWSGVLGADKLYTVWGVH